MEYGKRTRKHQSGHQSSYWLWTSVLNFSERHTLPTSPQLYFNCEHFLFVYIVKQNKNFTDLKKKFVDFQKISKIELC